MLKQDYGADNEPRLDIHKFTYHLISQSYAVALRIAWQDPGGNCYWAEGLLQIDRSAHVRWTETATSKNVHKAVLLHQRVR